MGRARGIQPELIRRLREERRLTQHDLAHKLRTRGFGTTQTTVSRWESGQSPHSSIVPALAESLGVSVDSLYAMSADDDDEEADPVADLTNALRRLVREEMRSRIHEELEIA